MDGKQSAQPAKIIWAYAYQIVPAQPEHRLRTIKTILDHEHTAALRERRTWAGRLVFEQQITHILVVSDSPEQNNPVNDKLEGELKVLKAAFSVTVPMAVDDGADAPSTVLPRPILPHVR
jgi:hypothetical protein